MKRWWYAKTKNKLDSMISQYGLQIIDDGRFEAQIQRQMRQDIIYFILLSALLVYAILKMLKVI
jgi:hypothetical protein